MRLSALYWYSHMTWKSILHLEYAFKIREQRSIKKLQYLSKIYMVLGHQVCVTLL